MTGERGVCEASVRDGDGDGEEDDRRSQESQGELGMDA